MLYYSPQIWCSDNTDALSRVDIQFGSSMCYPASVQGAHVSASPRASYETKRNVALWGSFGYELDPEKISDAAREEIRHQIADYHKYYDLIHYGDLYRLVCPWEDPYNCAWMFVDENKSQALATYLIKFKKERRNLFLRLKGLDSAKNYRLEETGEVYSGALLMNAGLNLTGYPGNDGDSFKIYLRTL
jgi:alpha-galactosidase